MAKPTNIFIMMHGMTPQPGPSSPFPVYDAFWEALKIKRKKLKTRIQKVIRVEWGHELPTSSPDSIRDDQKLTHAQQFVNDQTSYDSVRTRPGENNILLTGFKGDWNLIPFMRGLVTNLREGIILRGLGDVVYYTSTEGERRVRSEVYGQVLGELEDFVDDEDVRFHLFGHSLGVTLTHDFLYGLFHKDEDQDYKPDFIKDKQGTETACKQYKKWRDKAQNGTLTVGSLASSASQIPLFVMRKQDLVDLLFNEQHINSGEIGLPSSGRTRWKIFYDIDDILGFTTRSLYKPDNVIQEIQVDTADNPVEAHTDYWENNTVIRETADMINENSK